MKKFKGLLFVFTMILLLISCNSERSPLGSTAFILTTDLKDGKLVYLGVGGKINGMINPTLHAEPGENITVTLINGGAGKHDIVFPEINAQSRQVTEMGETVSITFTAPEHEGSFAYYDSVDNHAEIGMRGFLQVGKGEVVFEPSVEEKQTTSTNQPQETKEEQPETPGLYNKELTMAAFQKGGCAACHVIPGIPNAIGTIGPDLSEIGKEAALLITQETYTGKAKTVEEYLLESIVDPMAYISQNCPNGACQAGLMPATLGQTLSQDEMDAIVQYMLGLTDKTSLEPAPTPEAVSLGEVPQLTDEEFAWAKQTYFERCAGCHGTLRKGATGPALTPDLTNAKGTLALSAIIFNGTTRGMPDWGKQGFMTQEQTDVMAKFLQNEPPTPPEMSLEQMKASWKVFIPPDQRPASPQTTRDWENYFLVTLRDAGQVAVIDGDTYEVINTVNTGYAVHISRMSATGRYVYTIGRDGKLALIDLWMEIPDKVAETQLCYDARSVEVSKYNGPEGDFTDKLAIVGCYWPPHFVILDGQTLEPFKIVSTRSYTYDTEEFHPEPRVASILASHFEPEWILNVKETGQIWLVNYTDPNSPTIKMIEAARFLHDGGWDSTKRYFMVAANQSNKVAVVDAEEGKLVALVDTPQVPHPGRGANWIDPEYGPVWSTGHLGDASIVSIGTDPTGNPDSAWKAVRTTPIPGSGSLFIKTHPKSQWIWVDMTLNSDPVLSRTICVIAKSDPTKTYKCWEIGSYGRAVHMEYNKAGTEVWVSLWGSADIPGETGEIVVYDDETLEEKIRIKNLVTPTGKFNVYNTVHDIY